MHISSAFDGGPFHIHILDSECDLSKLLWQTKVCICPFIILQKFQNFIYYFVLFGFFFFEQYGWSFITRWTDFLTRNPNSIKHKYTHTHTQSTLKQLHHLSRDDRDIIFLFFEDNNYKNDDTSESHLGSSKDWTVTRCSLVLSVRTACCECYCWIFE